MSEQTELQRLQDDYQGALAERDEARAEVERTKRGARELGRILDRTLNDALDASGRRDVIAEDGDGDWALAWETLAELRPRAEAAEADAAGLRARTRPVLRRLSGLLETVESECEPDEVLCHDCDRTDDGRCALAADIASIEADLRAALAAEPTLAAEPHAEDGAEARFYFDPGPATHWVDGRRHGTPLDKCAACRPAPVTDPDDTKDGQR